MGFLNKLFGKNPIRSMTAWGLAALGIGKAAEVAGFLPPGTTPEGEQVTNAIKEFADSLGALFIVLGIRRAATAPNTG